MVGGKPVPRTRHVETIRRRLLVWGVALSVAVLGVAAAPAAIAATGPGTATVTASSRTAGATGVTLTVRYTAPATAAVSGTVNVVVPTSGYPNTAFTPVPSTANVSVQRGTCTSAALASSSPFTPVYKSGYPGDSPGTRVSTQVSCPAGTSFTITYKGVTLPRSTQTYTFFTTVNSSPVAAQPTLAITLGQVLFADYFADGNDNGWTQHNRTWQVIDGRYVLNGGYTANACNRGGWTTTHTGDTAWKDYSLSVDIDATPGATPDPWPEGEVLFRLTGQTDAESCYPVGYRLIVWVDYVGQPLIQLLRYNSVGNTYLAEIWGESATNLTTTDFTNRVLVEARGAEIAVWVNGKVILRYRDLHPILSGGIGLEGVWESLPAFDNVVVRSLT